MMWFGLGRPRSSSLSTFSNGERRNNQDYTTPCNQHSDNSILYSVIKEKEAALEKAQTQIDLLRERIDQLTHQLQTSEQLCEDLRKKCFLDKSPSSRSTINNSSNQDDFPIQMRVDGAGYTGHKQTARVWVGNMFITWLKVPVDEEDNPMMEKVRPIDNAHSPIYVPTIDDIGYQLIAECRLHSIRGPVVATSHSVTIEYDPDMLKVMIPLLKSGRAEFDAFYIPGEDLHNNRIEGRREEQQQKVSVTFVIKRHKTKFTCHPTSDSHRVVQLYYERCKQVTDIAVELETSSPLFAFKLRFPTYVTDSSASDSSSDSNSQPQLEEYCFCTRTSGDRDLLMATILESLKLYFGKASAVVHKGMESDGGVGLFQTGAHRVREATRKIFHKVPPSD